MADRSEIAVAAVLGAIASGLAPDPEVRTVEWATENFVLVDGPYEGELWNADNAPYMVPIFEAIDDEAVNVVSVRKSAQVAFTTAAIAWVGRNIDTAPSREMIIFPTLLSVQDFNREKLMPAIEASPALRRKVRSQTSRSSSGSTALSKRYPGGSLTLTGANSAADLRSKTTRRQFRDEIDEWPLDLEGQGDPYAMADARQIAYHATADWKRLEGSTPTIKGISRIDERFAAGDQRFFQVPCPHCGEFQRLEFGSKETEHGLKFEKAWPYNAHYICRHNGCVIEHHDKREMLRRGKFVAEVPGPGRHPSFHIDALSSNFTTWNNVAEAFLAAKDDPQKLKAFVNLWLGESWEERGDAPDWAKLMNRRGDYPEHTIPPGGLVLTAAADVQRDGIFYEVVAWGVDQQSWSIEIGYLPGSTATIDAPVWSDLNKVYERQWPDAYGGSWPVDQMAVDAGYQTQVVYNWTRRRHRSRAVKGVPGWYKPAIASAPSDVDLTYDGRRIKGLKLWPVGIWPLKSTLYHNLRKAGRRDGEEADPPGYCHFSQFHDEAFFKQLTAEHLKERESKGRMVKEWVARGPNHFHDTRIYNMAMAEALGLSTLTADQWKKIARDRGVSDQVQRDMFAARNELDQLVGPAEETPQPRPRRRVRSRGI